jgi:hypothetical protein
MKTICGTYYFPTFLAAILYYTPYLGGAVSDIEASIRHGDARALVVEKIKDGEIHIGKPEIKEGQELVLKDNRWHICG